jgi:hypothetical protein
VDNQDKTSNKKLIIYRLDNKSTVTLSFSKITDDTKNIYDISFCNEHLTWTPKLTVNKNAIPDFVGKMRRECPILEKK